MSLKYLAVLSSLSLVICASGSCHSSRSTVYGYYLQYSPYKKLHNERLGSCYLKCYADKNCSSVNYDSDSKTCEHLHDSKKGLPQLFVQRSFSIHAEARDPGHSSCKRILTLHPKAKSGIYWIRLGYGKTQTPPFQVYCDMETDGGGWTLVYSYRFVNFKQFNAISNAVIPIPNWPRGSYYSPTEVSKKVPLNETSYSAMDYYLWRKIGREFLIKPTITHWVSCEPGSGDLIYWRSGSIKCKIVKKVANKCFEVVPTTFSGGPCGPYLASSSFYIYFDFATNGCFPVHDPCGTTSFHNHLTDVTSPGGALYIR